jgi:hypothetical protein
MDWDHFTNDGSSMIITFESSNAKEAIGIHAILTLSATFLGWKSHDIETSHGDDGHQLQTAYGSDLVLMLPMGRYAQTLFRFSESDNANLLPTCII